MLSNRTKLLYIWPVSGLNPRDRRNRIGVGASSAASLQGLGLNTLVEYGRLLLNTLVARASARPRQIGLGASRNRVGLERKILPACTWSKLASCKLNLRSLNPLPETKNEEGNIIAVGELILAPVKGLREMQSLIHCFQFEMSFTIQCVRVLSNRLLPIQDAYEANNLVFPFPSTL